MTRITTLLFAVLLPAMTHAADVLPYHATEKTMPNGLKVIVVPTGFPNIVAMYIPVQTGSRNEMEPGKSGFAHFFEHIMSRGTPAYPPEKYNEVVTRAGARENANTSDDRTVYHIVFAKEDLPKIMEIYADRFMNLSYPEAAFKTEARAVLGEYNKNSANPVRKLIEVQHDAAYSTHTYKHTTMGFIKDIEDMPNQYTYSKEFFSRWYRPEYTTIIVTGDVKADEIVKLVEKYWGDWKRGTYKATIPAEAAHTAPVYAHVPWSSNTLPYVTVAFRGPAFTEMKDTAALETLFDLEFGETSDLHKKLVDDEQKVDAMFYDNDPHVDPYPFTVFARVKKMDDTLFVRDQILATLSKMREKLESKDRVDQAKSYNRYSLIRSLDNSEAVAETLSEFVKFHRSYDTLNEFYRAQAALTPTELRSAAKKFITDNNLIVTTLSKDAMPSAMSAWPKLATFTAQPVASAMSSAMSSSMQEPASATNTLRVITQKSIVPQVEFKLLFNSGSASDPQGKEGLAALAAEMVVDAGSQAMKIDEIRKALYPMAGAFYSRVDKDMTTLTGTIHRDNWKKFFDIAMPQLLAPAFRDEDFTRIKDGQLNALRENLRNNNEEELGKEELMNRLYHGTPYGHTPLGTVAGLQSITLDDVKRFIGDNYTRSNVVVGISGDYPDSMLTHLKKDVEQLPQGSKLATGMKGLAPIAGRKSEGLTVEIIQKETRATAISIGAPLPLTRADGVDFAALNVARAWLGEHRMSSGRLFNRLREIRGLNYGDYAYIEYFNNPGGQFFPSANIARRAQAFELWIRPVVPANAHMALRLALYELNGLVQNGLTKTDFENTRQYLMKNVYVATSTQDQQLGYALDSWWYGIPEYTQYMRGQYARLTLDDVNRAIRKYLSPADLNVVIVTKDAEALRDLLVSDAVSEIKYDAPKPTDIMDEDKVIGAYKLNIRPERVTITPVDNIFAK